MMNMMMMMMMTVLYTTTILSLSVCKVASFTASSHHPHHPHHGSFLTTRRQQQHQQRVTRREDSRGFVLRMAAAAGDDDDDTVDDEKAKTMKSVLEKEIAYDDNIGRFFETNIDENDCIPDEEFCILDKDTGKPIRLTLEEKERMFLDALQAYYSSGRRVLKDEEFDSLKEDLQWQGSAMVAMNKKEVKYLAAVEQFLKGKPVLSDDEFDTLKRELMDDGSRFAVQNEPKCYVDTGICKVTLQEDQFRSNLLYLPAGSLLMIGWLAFGFELIEPIIRLNPIILAIIGLPWVYTGSKSITENFLFKDKLIAYGPCPVCQYENRIYFGSILGVEGFTNEAEVKCPNCKETFKVQRSSLRASSLPKA